MKKKMETTTILLKEMAWSEALALAFGPFGVKGVRV